MYDSGNIESSLRCAHCGGSHASEDHQQQMQQNGNEGLVNYSYDVEGLDLDSGLVNYVNDLKSNYAWNSTGGLNSYDDKVTVTYTFADSDGHYGDSGATDYSMLDENQQSSVRLAMNEFEKVANIEFIESAEPNANIAIRQADLPSGIAGWAYYPLAGASDITFDHAYNSYIEGQFSYRMVMHEIGHSVGLSHPEDTGYSANYDNDGTVMSYYGGSTSYYGHYSQTLQIFDIATLQNIYGANTDYNSGDTNYEVDGTNERYTIWDGGGSDTIDASSYSGNSNINLNASESIVSQVGDTDFWLAYNANIENITSGKGDDVLTGNEMQNNISSGDGDDIIYASTGDDIITADSGRDNVYGEDGNDRIFGNQGADILVGGNGNDYIKGGVGYDEIYGNDDDDVIIGNRGFDYLKGGRGNDIIYGGNNGDTIKGNSGNDIIRGGRGADSINGGDDDDIIIGNAGDDFINGGSGDDFINGRNHSDIIDGFEGVDTLYGGGHDDIFVFSDLTHSTNDAMDTICDFEQGADLIDLSAFVFTSIANLSVSDLSDQTLVADNSSDFCFALDGIYNLTNSDFIFV